MIQLYLSDIHCNEETSELSAADEPYVLVTAVNLASSVPVAGFSVPLPAFDVVRYGPFDDVDDGETHFAPGITQSFWGINGRPAALTDPDQAIFVVALMEHDAGRPGSLQGMVKGIVGGSVLGSLPLDRGNKVANLIRDVSSAVGVPSGPSLDQDNHIGDPQELRFSQQELARARSGQAVPKTLNFAGDGGRYAVTFEARRVPPVAANVQDKAVVAMPDRILVITNSGGAHVHAITEKTVGTPFQLGGFPVAANPQDKWVLTIGNRILVITNNGAVHVHEVSGTTVKAAFQLGGPPVAANPQDKWVLTMDNRILVVVNDGRVFAHDITGNTVNPAFQLSGPRVAANSPDKWVLTMDRRILVITNTGGVHVHEITEKTVGVPFQLSGSPVAANPQDKWVLTMGRRILVVTNNGGVHVHEIGDKSVGAPFQLS